MDASQKSTSSNFMQFSFKNSLSEELGGKCPTFFELSLVLKKTIDQPIQNIVGLSQRIIESRERKNSQDDESIEKLKKFTQDLFTNQFSDPVAALGELLANAFDAQKSKILKESLEPTKNEFPVTIKISEEKIVVTDRGTGIGLSDDPKTGRSSFSHLMLPGLTTKYEDIQTNKRIDQIIGKFGQGFLSLFYFLIYHRMNRYNVIPTFKTPLELNNLLTVHATDKEGQTHQLIFSLEDNQIRVSSKLISEQPSLSERIKIISYDKAKQATELDFFYEKGELLVDVSTLYSMNKEEPLQGTTISIQSGLIAKIQKKAEKYLNEKFGLYENFPIYIEKNEGRYLINTGNNNFKKIGFDGGVLLFDDSSTTQKGTIGLYENGIQVVELATTCEVPIKVALNFDNLKPDFRTNHCEF